MPDLTQEPTLAGEASNAKTARNAGPVNRRFITKITQGRSTLNGSAEDAT